MARVVLGKGVEFMDSINERRAELLTDAGLQQKCAKCKPNVKHWRNIKVNLYGVLIKSQKKAHQVVLHKIVIINHFGQNIRSNRIRITNYGDVAVFGVPSINRG